MFKIKKFTFYFLIMIFALLLSCEYGEIKNDETSELVSGNYYVEPNTGVKCLVNPNRVRIEEDQKTRAGYLKTNYTDWSGEIEIAVWEASSPSAVAIICQVEPGWVCIGGGAECESKYSALTASFPIFDHKSWIAVHAPPAGTFKVYAVGIRILNVPYATLASCIRYNESKISQAGVYSLAAISEPDLSYSIVGGGGIITGNHFFFWSIPQNDYWLVGSGPLDSNYTGQTKAFSISMNRNIPGFGEIDITSISSNPTYSYSPLGGSSLEIPEGWVIGSVGGMMSYTSSSQKGPRMFRYLHALRPCGNNYNKNPYTRSTNFNSGTVGGTTTYATIIRKKPM